MLGPLFICLYINDLKLHLPLGTLHLLYANNLQAYIQIPPEDALLAIDTLTRIACKISDWSDSVSLCLDHKKTKAIFLSAPTFVEKLKPYRSGN